LIHGYLEQISANNIDDKPVKFIIIQFLLNLNEKNQKNMSKEGDWMVLQRFIYKLYGKMFLTP